MKTLIKLAAGLGAAAAFAGTASAGCGNSAFCGATTGTSTLPALSTYFNTAGSLSDYEASARYGAGSISSSYSDSYSGGSYSTTYGGATSYASSSYGYGSGYGGTSIQSFTGSLSSVPGLGAGESLQPTNCPVSVYNPEGGNVLGCYSVVRKVVQPVANTTYYRVVRPVIYVRYPVPVPVPYTVYSPCLNRVNYSRYGGFGPQGGFGGYGLGGGCR